MNYRNIENSVQGFRTSDGAGVSLVRVLGRKTTESYDPFLMLDSFNSENPEDYMRGFPMHPHRGIETITFMAQGGMTHRDSLGNEDSIQNNEVQWMTAGSGIMHEEMPLESDRMLGVQLWLNLPAKDKMCSPAYHKITQDDMIRIEKEHAVVELIAGEFEGKKAFQSQYQPVDFYHIILEEGAELELPTRKDSRVILFTLENACRVADTDVPAKTAVALSEGDAVKLSAKEKARVLFLQSEPLREPIAWGGPVVMNTQTELRQAFADLRDGNFLKEELKI